MRKIFSFFLVVLSLALITQPALAINYKVVLLGGQSNMDGRASTSSLPSNLKSQQTDVKLFYDDIPNNNLSNFTVPSAYTSLSPQVSGGANFGPEITFGRTMADGSPSDHYALIKYARGGTTLAVDWKPGTGGNTMTGAGTDYINFRNTVTAGLNALTSGGNTYEIAGMLWLQGESDTGTFASAYKANLTGFISNMRSYFGSNLPFVIGGMGYDTSNGPSYTTVTAAQQSLAGSLPEVAFFDDSDLHKFSSLHFDAAGQELIGQRYASALVSIPEPTAVVSLIMASVFLLPRRRRLAKA